MQIAHSLVGARIAQSENRPDHSHRGNVICRQRPGTAKGFVFITVEDETGMSNAIVAPKLFEKLRLVITQESFLMIEGRLQNSENVIHIRAEKIERLSHENLAGSSSYDFN